MTRLYRMPAHTDHLNRRRIVVEIERLVPIHTAWAAMVDALPDMHTRTLVQIYGQLQRRAKNGKGS